MEIICIESTAFKLIQDQIADIQSRLNEIVPLNENEMEWLDNEDVCRKLKISKRKLQYLRDSKTLEFTRVGRKILYKRSSIEAFLESNLTGGIL